MSVGWVLYTLGVGLVAGSVAHAAEILLRHSRRQARGVWLCATLFTASVAVLPRVGELAEPSVEAAALVIENGAALPGDDVVANREATASPAVSALHASIPWSGTIWLSLSVGFASVLVGWELRVRRVIRTARTQMVAGRRVLVTTGFGPAAVGVLRGRIAVPCWMLRRLDTRLLTWVVEHEAEHLRGRDVHLLAACAVLVAVAPWNLPLWWLVIRLRRAVELDCDLRMLRRQVEPREYGHLLLSVAALSRGSVLSPALAHRGVLRARIEQIADRRPDVARIAGAMLVSAALIVGTVACDAPPVVGVDIGGEDWRQQLPIVDARVSDTRGFRNAVESAARNPAAQGAEGVVALSLRIDDRGRVIGIRIDAASGPAIDPQAIELASLIARRTRLSVEGSEAGGWTPLWVAFLPGVVEAYVVSPSVYVSADLANDANTLVRYIELFRQLHGADRARWGHTIAAADRIVGSTEARIFPVLSQGVVP